MPRINLYVSEENKPLFDKAADILGEDSLSSAIASALKKAIEAKQAEQEGFEKVELEVGTTNNRMGESDNLKTIRFIGKELAWIRNLHGQTGSGDDRGTTYTLYLTQKGKFLLHIDEWSRWQGESSHSRYKVYESMREIEEKEGLDQLIREAKEALGEDLAIELDI